MRRWRARPRNQLWDPRRTIDKKLLMSDFAPSKKVTGQRRHRTHPDGAVLHEQRLRDRVRDFSHAVMVLVVEVHHYRHRDLLLGEPEETAREAGLPSAVPHAYAAFAGGS